MSETADPIDPAVMSDDELARAIETIHVEGDPEAPGEAPTERAEPAHGQVESEWSRYCGGCKQTHDFLHLCHKLPNNVLALIQQHRAQLAAMCADPAVAQGRGLRLGELVLRRLWAGHYG